jgi:hypothetical protein
MIEEGSVLDRNVGLLIQLVQTGGFGGLLWYIIVKHNPRQIELSRVDRTEQRDSFLRELTNQRVAFESALERIEEAHKDELGDLRTATQQLVTLIQAARARDRPGGR